MCRFLRSFAPVEFAKGATPVGYLRFKQHGILLLGKGARQATRRTHRLLLHHQYIWSLSVLFYSYTYTSRDDVHDGQGLACAGVWTTWTG